jgi:5,5'-dehydrodivanillate O-demethylase
VRLSGETGPYSPKHVKVAFEEVEHGLIYKRIREDTDEANDLWSIGRVALWPVGMFLGDHIEWRVPIDDRNTLSVTWHFLRLPRESEPFEQESVPYWYGPIKDDQGRWISSHVMNQDFAAWVGQGVIADRMHERLGKSDEGVLMMRRLLFADMDRVARGEDPKAVVRDGDGGIVSLPVVERDRHVVGRTRGEIRANPALRRRFAHYPYQAGQPDAVRQALWAAAGLSEADLNPKGQ